MSRTMNVVDAQIVGCLRFRGLRTAAQVAQALSLPYPKVYPRLRRLERQGVVHRLPDDVGGVEVMWGLPTDVAKRIQQYEYPF